MIAHTGRKVQHLYDSTIFNPFYNELLLIVYRYVDTRSLSDKKLVSWTTRVYLPRVLQFF